MKFIFLVLYALSLNCFADEVTFEMLDENKAQFVVSGAEAEKLYTALSNVQPVSGTSQPRPGLHLEKKTPFPGVSCSAEATDRLPVRYKCKIKFSDVSNGTPE